MLSISVSDIIKLLDQIPIWKTVSGLPKRLAELERRVGELESAAKALPAPTKIPAARICPLCDAEMKVVSEIPHPTFGFAGLKIHSLVCSGCQSNTQRNFKPGLFNANAHVIGVGGASAKKTVPLEGFV